mmetsp:Transcript_98883/g.282725  ORF Transcript_98883/g.282725 Transcript_98883/m.282725 type:complete len:241 (+) Transcript_98883:944-1666(+)
MVTANAFVFREHYVRGAAESETADEQNQARDRQRVAGGDKCEEESQGRQEEDDRNDTTAHVGTLNVEKVANILARSVPLLAKVDVGARVVLSADPAPLMAALACHMGARVDLLDRVLAARAGLRVFVLHELGQRCVRHCLAGTEHAVVVLAALRAHRRRAGGAFQPSRQVEEARLDGGVAAGLGAPLHRRIFIHLVVVQKLTILVQDQGLRRRIDVVWSVDRDQSVLAFDATGDGDGRGV